MVITTKSVLRKGVLGRGPRGAAQLTPKDVIYVTPHDGITSAAAITRTLLPNPGQDRITYDRDQARQVDDDADDIIDLGAPLLSRKERAGIPNAAPPPPRRSYVPNPRLYPGSSTKPKPRPRRSEAKAKGGRNRQRKRTLRRPLPNSRLYRPAPPRIPPPPAQPRTSWPPPPPPRHLDTASRVALRLGERRQAARGARSPLPGAPRSPPPAPRSPPSRRLVVTLPATAAGGDSPEPTCYYHPQSKHFRASSSPHSRHTDERVCSPLSQAHHGTQSAMDATASRHSASPEDCSDGNETLSAPSEFLAEFLSAIMQRQYAEALKYCRLILQYEPHNATARGFYPLLQHKLLQHATAEEEDQQSSSEAASAHSGDVDASPPRQDELMEQTGDSEEEGDEESGGSVASQSSLELDSEPSLELSRRTDSGSRSGSGSGTGSVPCWESTGSASRSDADDNGNAPLPPLPSLRPCDGDLENDNAAAGGAASGEPHHSAHLKNDSVSSLRRLRAQFACSIK